MVYISRDGVIGGRSPWSPGRIVDFFWAIINFFVLFFQTLFQPDLTKRGRGYTSNYGAGSNGRQPPGPPGYPRRRMGGFGSSIDCSSAPMGGG